MWLVEGIAARSYTGPMFVKYNGVLRGLDSPVPFLKNSMIELCCSAEMVAKFKDGTMTYDEVRPHINLFTTTLFAINSGVVKLSRIQPAFPVRFLLS